ncbi:hypothetical protein I204_00133 [Kwoniella mangroviensis CBS 8886]|uniref:uncharacterized protein n=1 Tax=Kwoniella mangroviensis CBS 8507 TaxID=1296122 RepID=UPI00080D5975|nr:uncharacterized protein I203_02691 [Kwoniella mangroviensis CBS 8507]OCF68032.1 hypothetical protein I203_02691 [Kwoniella mangroviensis CBS 8507]OCF78196.1 hypothetical protein I204_00133 [Kwoniella mangroviensis CBS 8886]
MVPRLAIYGLSSTLLASGVVYSALNTRPNFYAAAVALGRSSGALMVLANFALFNTILFGIGLKKIFFGQLRAIEYEHLFERLWIFLTESLLALTIFRDDFSAPFAFMYCLLLFLKCFHWITADRVDYMDQIPPPGPPTLYHIRITSIIVLLAIFDFALVSYSIEAILSEGVSAMVLFASEFTILNASILGTAARYAVGLVDLRRARGRADAPPWEEKSMWLFYVDLTVDFMKLLTYLSFFLVILLHYGLPLHILRDVYMTLRSFISRCGDLIRYRRATRDMDALYPDATEEEMERGGDRTCIICREEMIPRAVAEREGNTGSGEGGGPNETPKKLACGHIFHFHCLRSWLERQQSCPTCRRDVLHTPAPAPGRAAAQRNAAGGNPPPAQPGAVPQQPQQQDRNNIQQAYNEYFQLPRMGWDNPVPVPQPTALPQAGSQGNTARREDSIDERLQRGIWGGPIIPGRFFPAPLGAAPRFQQSSTHAGPSSPFTPPLSQPSSSRITQPAGQNPPPTISRREFHLSVPATPQMSGSVTPFSSNPPVVFSPTGTARPIPQVEGENDDKEVEEVVEVDEVAVRRKAAEAALKRFGGSTFHSASIGKVKGKGKEKEVPVEAQVGNQNENINLDDWETLPTVHPRLIPSSSDLLGDRQHQHPNLSDSSSVTAAGSLEERIQVLRKVDETIWGLVGELTRLQSSWQAEREGLDSISDKEEGSGPGPVGRPRLEIPDEDQQ